jgi:regulator of protease activity HflC (stomatin/prohibitin superfamily)
MSFLRKDDGDPNAINISIILGITTVFVIILLMIIIPKYTVWSKEMSGRAQYAEAEQNRKIKILEAEAKKESAKLEAEAEVERSKGVQQANAIIADGLKGHDEYLRYLWITHLETGDNKEVIYVPTEAQIPILEAGKR